jgi:hypothetical protein
MQREGLRRIIKQANFVSLQRPAVSARNVGNGNGLPPAQNADTGYSHREAIMMTEYEVQNLRQSMNANLSSGPMSIWKCVAGLLAVIALLLAGNWLDPLAGPSIELAQLEAQSKFPLPGDDN